MLNLHRATLSYKPMLECQEWTACSSAKTKVIVIQTKWPGQSAFTPPIILTIAESAEKVHLR